MDAPLYALVRQSDEAETSAVLPRRGKTSVPARNKLRQDPQNQTCKNKNARYFFKT